jgi:PAT family beta-lactamase induction signal transducer AmpG
MIKETVVSPGAPKAGSPAHPAWFGVIILPYGVIQGYISVTLAYVYRNSGMSVQQIAGLVAMGLIPNIFKFVWAPLVDLSFTVKKWYILATAIISLGILVLGLIPGKPANIAVISIIILISFIAVSFEGIAVSSLMAYDTPPEKLGFAGGCYNAGSVGGIGIGGGAGVLINQFVGSQAIGGAIIAGFCALCCLGILFVNEPQVVIKANNVSKAMGNLFKDIWKVVKVRSGVFGLFLSLLPLGTGAVGNLFAAMATDWHASLGAVALATGFWSGIITAVGCFIAGFICDAMNRQLSYLLFGVFQAVCALGMAFCPHTQLWYIVWTLAYAFANGFAYAAFSAFVLEVIGKGAAGTKYNLYAGVSNIPIYSMVIIDGWANTRWGPTGTLVIEAVCTGIGVIVFFALKALTYSRLKAGDGNNDETMGTVVIEPAAT